MKRLLLIFPLLFLLTGCGSKVIYGEVASIVPKEGYFELTIVGKDDIVLADEKTMIYSFSGIEAGLLEGELIQPYITAYDLTKKSGGYYSDRIYVESVILPEPYILEDGTKLTVRKDYTHTTYFTPEGIDILWEQEPIGPHNVSAGELPSLNALSGQAQEKILAYYEAQGLLYDLDSELETAWQAYLQKEEKENFPAHHLSQDTIPMSASPRIISFATVVTRPIDGNHVQEIRYGAIFDRETGELIPLAELFQCSEEEIGQAVLLTSGIADQAVLPEMLQAFQLEYLHLNSDSLEIRFPSGSLPSQNTEWIVCVKYDQLTDILHSWAIPENDNP